MKTDAIMRSLKILSLTIALALVGSVSLLAQEPVEGDDADGHGTLQVVDEYDWGQIGPGELKADIEIKNTGNGPLQINHVKPSCGCTAAPLDDYLLDPGESTTMHVSLNASRSTGPIHKSVAIFTDDPENQTKYVQLRANIQRDLTFQPNQTFMVFENAVVGQEARAAVRITNTSDHDVTLHPIELSDHADVITFNLPQDRVLKPGEEFELVATALPTAEMTLNAKAKLTTSSENVPNRDFTVYASVKAPTTTDHVMTESPNDSK
jgi:hypothetical protein